MAKGIGRLVHVQSSRVACVQCEPCLHRRWGRQAAISTWPELENCGAKTGCLCSPRFFCDEIAFLFLLLFSFPMNFRQVHCLAALSRIPYVWTKDRGFVHLLTLDEMAFVGVPGAYLRARCGGLKVKLGWNLDFSFGNSLFRWRQH